MTDIVKGILIGIIVVKVYESDAVQNYIHKAIRKKGREVAKNIADAVLPVTEEKPEKESEYKILYKSDGRPVIVKRREYHDR